MTDGHACDSYERVRVAAAGASRGTTPDDRYPPAIRPPKMGLGRHTANLVRHSPHLAMSTAADRESRLRELAAANFAVGSQSSLEDVLQKTADVAARLVDARYGALGVLDRTGAHLEHLVTSGMD